MVSVMAPGYAAVYKCMQRGIIYTYQNMILAILIDRPSHIWFLGDDWTNEARAVISLMILILLLAILIDRPSYIMDSVVMIGQKKHVLL